MLATKAFREVMKLTGFRQKDLSERLGVSQNALNNRLTRDNITVSKLAEMSKAVGYKVVLIPHDVILPDGFYEIE